MLRKRQEFDYKDRMNEQRKALLEEMRKRDDEIRAQQEAQKVQRALPA